MTSARPMPVADADDHLLPENTATIGVLIRCGCHRNPQVRNVHVTEEAIRFFRTLPIPPDLVVESFRCPDRCKQKIKITARMLYFAA